MTSLDKIVEFAIASEVDNVRFSVAPHMETVFFKSMADMIEHLLCQHAQRDAILWKLEQRGIKVEVTSP